MVLAEWRGPEALGEGGLKRREFFTLVGGGAALALPLVARAQPQPMPVIGFLSNTSPEVYMVRLREFRRSLKEMGWVEGENVAVEYRWADNQNDQLRRWRPIWCAAGSP